CCDVFGWQCGEPFLLAAHFRRPGCPFGFIGQFHADKVANKSGWFCHDLVGYWAGAASQGRVNGYQEVLFIPVLSNGEPVGDGIAGDSSDKTGKKRTSW